MVANQPEKFGTRVGTHSITPFSIHYLRTDAVSRSTIYGPTRFFDPLFTDRPGFSIHYLRIDAVFRSTIYGSSTIYGPPTIDGPSIICGPSTISGPSMTYGPSRNNGPSITYGSSRTYGHVFACHCYSSEFRNIQYIIYI